jgi:hypothetical protein
MPAKAGIGFGHVNAWIPAFLLRQGYERQAVVMTGLFFQATFVAGWF